MKMPGLTAEISLYKTYEHYHMIGAANQTDGVIQLAQIGSVLPSWIMLPTPKCWICDEGGCGQFPCALGGMALPK